MTACEQRSSHESALFVRDIPNRHAFPHATSSPTRVPLLLTANEFRSHLIIIYCYLSIRLLASSNSPRHLHLSLSLSPKIWPGTHLFQFGSLPNKQDKTKPELQFDPRSSCIFSYIRISSRSLCMQICTLSSPF